MRFVEETTEEKAKKVLKEIIKDRRVTSDNQMNFLTLHYGLFSFQMFKKRKVRNGIF